MKHYLRLALPPLAEVAPESRMAYALFDRGGRLLRSGEQSLERLSATVPVDHVQAILHPGDAIVVTINLPPLPARRLEAAVQASVEPMALSDLSDLCIAHGQRSADGNVCVAWAGRRPLLDAWRRLGDAGLRLDAVVPLELALPSGDPHTDQPLALPAGARWQAPLPKWSLARPEWQPARQTLRWGAALRWAGAAALLWLLGLHLHAAQLRNQTQALQAATERAVRDAFPSIPVVLDPLRQARGQRDMLRLAHGMSGQDDFMPLAMGAAEILDFAQGRVASLRYEDGTLTLALAEGYTPPADETVLRQAAAARSLTLRKDDDTAHTWHISRNDAPASREPRP
ncbi:general secretion pathway protein GspL [Alcaligenaceae bacterium]|nr:general secretion pathway protein GspL [Alcaligenaceae bacterium]